MRIEFRPADSLPNTPLKQIDTLTFPPERRSITNVPNPQGTAIEFMVSETNIPAMITLLRDLLPFFTSFPHPIERLCIYRLDKRELYEIGS